MCQHPTPPAHQKLLILEKRVCALGSASCCNTPSVVDLTIPTTAHLTSGVTETFAGAGGINAEFTGGIRIQGKLFRPQGQSTGSTPCVSFNEHQDPSYSKAC